MADLTGFLKYDRENPKDIPPAERLQNWNEFHTHSDLAFVQKQAARCMDCGTPFCTTGSVSGVGSIGCPLNNAAPEWNDLIYHGLVDEAAARLLRTNNFPEFTGRVCPALCETACTLGLIREPTAIRNTECFIAEHAFDKDLFRYGFKRTGKRAAVVGSGPAGLAVADTLNALGHDVTVFERADRLGGLLMYGIPNMKLDKTVVERRIGLMERQGVKFVTNADIKGREDLGGEFDAVALCCGATVPRELAVEGRDKQGVYFAVDFLTRATKRLLSGGSEDDVPDVNGKNVVVVGGGDTGNDCVATVLRLGAAGVTQIEVMPKNPITRDECGAAGEWPYFPRLHKVDYGQEEAMHLFGADPRVYNTTVTAINGGERVESVTTVCGEFKEQGGKVEFVPDETTEKTVPADLVLLAMGFVGAEKDVLEGFGVGNVYKDGYGTDNENVFIAGDMRRGQSLVVWAIREGREAAFRVHEYLRRL